MVEDGEGLDNIQNGENINDRITRPPLELTDDDSSTASDREEG